MTVDVKKPARRLKMNWDPQEKRFIHPIIQWFIHNDNLGTAKYKGQNYNLSRASDRTILSAQLILDGLITIEGMVVYDDFSGKEKTIPAYFSVNDGEYQYIRCKDEIYFWINLVDRLLPQMTEEECQAYNDAWIKEDPKCFTK